MRALNHAHIFDIPLRADNGIDLDRDHAGARRSRARLSATTRSCGNASPRSAKFISVRHHTYPQPALLHGDYYPGSWLQASSPRRCDHRSGVRFHRSAGIRRRRVDRAFHVRPHRPDRSDDGAAQLQRPRDFSLPLALAFAGIEVIRRLLGVAQLPLSADLATKATWLAAARQFVVAA